jgi:hypothetical protein
MNVYDVLVGKPDDKNRYKAYALCGSIILNWI